MIQAENTAVEDFSPVALYAEMAESNGGMVLLAGKIIKSGFATIEGDDRLITSRLVNLPIKDHALPIARFLHRKTVLTACDARVFPAHIQERSDQSHGVIAREPWKLLMFDTVPSIPRSTARFHALKYG